MKRWRVLVIVLALAGCSASRESSVPARRLEGSHPYRVMNDSCLCEEYQVRDPRGPVAYTFAASYEVEDGIATTIKVVIRSESSDTIQTSDAYVKVTSQNVAYQYNDRFVPLAIDPVPPGGERTVTLVGKSTNTKGSDPWLAVAGEEMVVTLRGLKTGNKRLSTQTITFVPDNPRFSVR